MRPDETTTEGDATELVPRESLELESGDVVPLDGRLLEETDPEEIGAVAGTSD